jgi:hypothetical protein
MGFSRKIVVSLIVAPRLAMGSLAFASVAGASTSHSMMAAHTWKGKITKLDAKIGTIESFSFVVDMKTYTVHYTSMTTFEMGNATMLKKGTAVTVTGTLRARTSPRQNSTSESNAGAPPYGGAPAPAPRERRVVTCPAPDRMPISSFLTR